MKKWNVSATWKLNSESHLGAPMRDSRSQIMQWDHSSSQFNCWTVVSCVTHSQESALDRRTDCWSCSGFCEILLKNWVGFCGKKNWKKIKKAAKTVTFFADRGLLGFFFWHFYGIRFILPGLRSEFDLTNGIITITTYWSNTCQLLAASHCDIKSVNQTIRNCVSRNHSVAKNKKQKAKRKKQGGKRRKE